MNKKVLLITPPYHCGVLESSGTWMPLGFAYLAGALKKHGYDVRIYDAMSLYHSHDEIIETVKEYQPDVVGSTAYTATLKEALKILSNAKTISEDIVTCLGGIHSTFCDREVLDENAFVDYIVRSEGEETFPELLDTLFKGEDVSKVLGVSHRVGGSFVRNASRPLIEDIETIEAAWDLVNWDDYGFTTTEGSRFALVNSSRGCTQDCSFCSQKLFWQRSWRARKPEAFVAELEMLNERYGVNVIMITDEVPTLDRERWEQILDILIEKDMDLEILMETRVDDILRDEDIIDKYRKAGILHIYVGVEASNQETLDKFNKNIEVSQSKKALDIINKADIISETSLVMGMPDETKASIRRTLELAKHYNPDLAFFLAIAPWPYADIYNELKPHIEDFDYSNYNLVEPIVKPEKMTRNELYKELINCFRSFYMNKLKELDKMTPFKRRYFIKVMRQIMNNSYLTKEMQVMGGMPKLVQKYLDELLSD